MGFITVDGENQIALKQGGGQVLNITEFVLANVAGLGAEPVNRVEAMPDPADIMATLPVTKSGYVNTNQVVYSLVMDSSLGDYDFNWVGLRDADGVLIAVTYTPLIQKRATAGAVPGNNLTRNFLIAFSGIQATAAIAVPAETWQIDFNARLHGIDERERLSNYDIYDHEAFIADGWSVVRQGATTTYDVLPGIAYVGGVRIASAVSQDVTIAALPASVWLDVSLQGDISDVSAVADFVIDAVAHNDYVDANGFEHYVTKLCDVAADGSVTDVRVLNVNVADHEAKVNPHGQYLFKTDHATAEVGEVITFAGTSAPVGFLELDASELSEVTFANLFARIGHTWDTTGGVAAPAAGFFRMPPSEIGGLGVYFRNVGAVGVGVYEADVFKSHEHSFYVRESYSNSGSNTNAICRKASVTPSATLANNDGSIVASGDTIETRPRSITMLHCIKF